MPELGEWTDDMREITGAGDDLWSYEQGCRDMVSAGVEWLAEHDDAEPVVSEFENVTGVINPENDDAEAMIDHMVAVAKENHGESPTGAMVQAS